MATITRPTGRQAIAYDCGRSIGRHQPGIAIVARVFGYVPREALTYREWRAYIVLQHRNWWPPFLQGIQDGLGEWQERR